MSKQMIDKVEDQSTTINIRASVRQRNLIDRAAQSLGKTRTEFMLEAASRSAEETLINQVFFHVSEDDYDKILDIFDGPVEINQNLQNLLRRKPRWA